MSGPRWVLWIFPALTAGLGCDALFAQTAPTPSGQSYPSKPIRFLTTGIGAGTDLAARTVAQGLFDSAGWNVIVDNRGSTIVSAEVTSRSPPDGYSLLVSTDGLWRGGYFQKRPFDPVRDFM